MPKRSSKELNSALSSASKKKIGGMYEIGIYKLTRYNGATPTSYYSKFNVTLKKVSGIWKIHSDSDTNEENTISEEDFLKGSIIKY